MLMKEEINNKINERLKSLREIADVSYTKPENRNEEYDKRLFKNMEAVNYLQYDRKIDYKTIKHFNLGLSEYGELAIPIYKNGELINYKFRTLPPKKKDFKHIKGAEMWIFNDIGIEEGKKIGEICITEGEIDTISVYQAGFKNVISVTNGSESTGLWIEKLNEIKKIFINFDNDDAGKKGALKLAERLGIEKCINVVTPSPYKDANEFFLKESPQAYKSLLLNSTKFPIEDVVKISDLYKEIIESPEFIQDFQFPFSDLQKLTGGFSNSQIVTISAISSHGKSLFAQNILTKLAEKNTSVMYVPLEDRIRYFGRRVFNIVAGQALWKLTREERKSILGNKLVNFPFFVYTGLEKFNFEVFKKIIDRGKKLYGIEIFCIDYLDFLLEGKKNEVEEIGQTMKELALIAREYNIVIFILVQVRKKREGDEGWKKIPSIDSILGSNKIRSVSHLILMLFQDFEFGGTPYLQVQVQKNREGNKHWSRDDFFIYNLDLETSIVTEQVNETNVEDNG